MVRSGHFNVAPRYTPGSPALIDEATARRAANAEKEFIEHALSGAWGEEQKARAARLGLRGIVEYRVEQGSGKKLGWDVLDLCTGERFFRLANEALVKLGYKRFEDLPWWAQQAVEKNPPAVEEYKTRAWFLPNAKAVTVKFYEPELRERAE